MLVSETERYVARCSVGRSPSADSLLIDKLETSGVQNEVDRFERLSSTRTSLVSSIYPLQTTQVGFLWECLVVDPKT